MDDAWVARNMQALIASLEAKLAAAEAKVSQCREVLREREFVGGVGRWACPDCGAYWFNQDEDGVYRLHKPDCAWKRAMEDA